MTGMTSLYGRALLRQLPLVGARGGDALPDTVLTREDVEVSRDALREYDEVCGFRLSDVAPPTWLHMPAFPLAMELMTRGDFPFGVMGLVHIANRIEQQRAARAGEHVSLRVHAEGLADHARGRQFDIVSEAFGESGESIWLEHSTYLRREGGGGSSGGSGRERGESSPPSGQSSPPSRQSSPPSGGAVWRVPGDVGRRYAAVSGDRNPIHLHGLTARAFGQPKPIAHGMWLEARCLAALEGRVPEAAQIDVRFKLPVPLGSKVALTSHESGDTREFRLVSASDGRPHLTGTVRTI
jgi:acyl dehydratase